MPKKLGISPKNLDSRMSLATDALEAKRLLRRAVPRLEDEKLKTWFPRAARLLNWNQRRVRAYWNEEARTIHHREILTLNQRIDALKAAETAAGDHADAIRRSMEMGSERSPLDGGAT